MTCTPVGHTDYNDTVQLDDIEQHTDVIVLVADWRDDLRARIARARLIMELADSEYDTTVLEDEVATFKKVCRCLSLGKKK
jgi:hypothetical protein